MYGLHLDSNKGFLFSDFIFRLRERLIFKQSMSITISFVINNTETKHTVVLALIQISIRLRLTCLFKRLKFEVKET